ncbi:solute carrier family 2, facilitated glucose transporter member 6-like isoform X2 [Rhynchophorus ferrugineus]
MAVSDGMTYGWTSPMIPYFLSNQTHIEVTLDEAEWLETITLLGAIAGLPFTILGVDRLGRKMSMILSALVGFICWTIILFTTSLELLYTARFFLGIAGDMCFVAAPMYVAEIAEPKIRGFLASVIYLQMLLGIILVYTIGALAPYYAAPSIAMALTSCQVIFFPLMPESPYYYMYKNQEANARQSLVRLRSDSSVETEINEIRVAVARQKLEKSRPQDIVLIRSNRFAMAIMVLLNSGQQMIGISVMLMNLHSILEEAGSVYIESSLSAIIFSVIMLFSAGVASLIMDKFGRKFLLISSGLLTGVVLLIMAIYFHLKNLDFDVIHVSWIPAVCVMAYAATFKLGLGLVPIVITAEIFPTTVKAIGMTLADTVYVIAAAISINIYYVLYRNFGIHVPFYMFTACSFLMAIFTAIWIPETKGKTLDEIQLMLKGKKAVAAKESSEPNISARY